MVSSVKKNQHHSPYFQLKIINFNTTQQPRHAPAPTLVASPQPPSRSLFHQLWRHRTRLNPKDAYESETIERREEDPVLAEEPVTQFALLYRPSYVGRRHAPPTAHCPPPTAHASAHASTHCHPLLPRYWWFEIYNMFRRLLLTCVVLIMNTLAQTIVFVVCVAIVTLVIEQECKVRRLGSVLLVIGSWSQTCDHPSQLDYLKSLKILL